MYSTDLLIFKTTDNSADFEYLINSELVYEYLSNILIFGENQQILLHGICKFLF